VSKAEVNEEPPTFKALYKEIPYEVTVLTTNRAFFSEYIGSESMNSEHLMIDNVINFIIKQAQRQIKGLHQMGRRPNFYYQKLAKDLSEGLRVVPGFKSSSFKFQLKTAVMIDNANKFMSL
jgi:hypothetical protein